MLTLFILETLKKNIDSVRILLPLLCIAKANIVVLFLSMLYKGYIVLNRPWAFVQWLEKATIDEV